MKKKPAPVKKKPAAANLGGRAGRGVDSDDSDDSANKKPAAVPGKRGGRGRGHGRSPLSSHGRSGRAAIHSNDLSPVARMPGGRTPASVKAQGGRLGGRTPGSARSQGPGQGSPVQITLIQNPNVASLQEASPASLESDHDVGEEEESQSGQSGSGEECDDASSIASLYKITTLGDSEDDEDKTKNMTPETKRKAEQAASEDQKVLQKQEFRGPS